MALDWRIRFLLLLTLPMEISKPEGGAMKSTCQGNPEQREGWLLGEISKLRRRETQ